MQPAAAHQPQAQEAAAELLEQLAADCLSELSTELKASASVAPGVNVEMHAPPAGASGNKDGRMMDGLRRLVQLHPSYPSLVKMFYACKRNSCSARKRSFQDLDLEEAAHLAGVKKLKQSYGQVRLPAKLTIELGEFMDRKMQSMERLKTELDSCRTSITKAAELVDQTLSDVLSCASLLMDLNQVQGETVSGKSTEQEANQSPSVGKDGKRKATNLNQIKDELMRKRKKGKLPDSATEILKDWWDANQSHPYPSEEQKRQLREDTGLDNAQLNNWFINQRKRHWAPRATSQGSPDPGSARGSNGASHAMEIMM